MSVKYQVERRPIGPTGKVYRGTTPGDYISVLTNPSHTALGGSTGIVDKVSPLAKGMTTKVSYVPAGQDIPALSNSMNGEDFSHVLELSGEPWLVFSTHFSIESALNSAAPLSSAIGTENVRIVKVLNSGTSFNLK